MELRYTISNIDTFIEKAFNDTIKVCMTKKIGQFWQVGNFAKLQKQNPNINFGSVSCIKNIATTLNRLYALIGICSGIVTGLRNFLCNHINKHDILYLTLSGWC